MSSGKVGRAAGGGARATQAVRSNVPRTDASHRHPSPQVTPVGGDPRRPADARRFPRAAAGLDEPGLDNYFLVSMMVSLAGFVLKVSELRFAERAPAPGRHACPAAKHPPPRGSRAPGRIAATGAPSAASTPACVTTSRPSPRRARWARGAP